MIRVKQRNIIFLINCVLLVFSIIGEASATTYYIATNGSNSNSGSISSPWATFNYAIPRLYSGDTLIVKSGTYHQSITAERSGSAGSPITIKGELDGNGSQQSFINPGVTISSWTHDSSGVYTASLGYETSSMTLEVGGATYDINKICHPDTADTTAYNANKYCSNWLTTLRTGENATWTDSSESGVTVDYWDGIEAVFASDGNTIYMRFSDVTTAGIPPTNKGVIRVSAMGATVDIGSHSYITVKDLKIRASQQGVSINGGTNNVVDNNLIINGQRAVSITSGSSNTISDNIMYSKSYSSYLNGRRLGYGAWNNSAGSSDVNSSVVNRHSYLFHKYEGGWSNSSIDESGIWINGASNCNLTGNTIFEGADGFILTSTSNCEISDNTVYDIHGLGIQPYGTNTGLSVHDNLFYNNNYGLRFQYLESATLTGNIYNNRFWLPPSVGAHIKFHINAGQASVTGTKDVWIYHNTFSGGYEFSNISDGISSYSQNPLASSRFVNNIISSERFEGQWKSSVNMGLCSYNWTYGSGQDWCSDTGNRDGASLMWNTTSLHDFDPTDSNAISTGIDISQQFTVNEQTYSPLPGFQQSYYAGSNPDMGAGQYTSSVNTCTSFTYSSWGACQSDNTQSRTLTSSSPSGCTGGTPQLVQSCTYNPVPPDYSVLKTIISPTIDGDITEYGAADPFTFSPSSGGNTVTIRAVWNSEALYLGIKITDTQIRSTTTSRDGSVWSDDAVEWFIDTYNDGGGSGDPNSPYMRTDDYQGILNTLNTQYDSQGTVSGTPASSWNGSWDSAVIVNEANNYYNMEIKIPWTSIGYSSAPSDDTVVGLSFAVNDKDDSGFATLMWPNISASNQNASNWQRVLLSGTALIVDNISPLPPTW